MSQSPIRKLAPLAFAAEERGVKVYRLNIGQPDLPALLGVLNVQKKVDRKVLKYSLSQGFNSLRQKLVN